MFSLFETFIVVYETKSFTLAGKYLFISQPTVTVRIKKLEEELKSTLFLRGKHQEIIPTEAAILFYPKAIAYLKKWEEDQAEVQKKSLAKHPFKIGVSHSAALSIMPRIFKVFEGELEHLDVEINMYDSEKVFELVANHDLHFGIIERLLISDQTKTFPLFLDELVLAGNTDSETFFTRESGSGIGYYIKRYLKSAPSAQRNIVRMNSNEMIISHIKAGLGSSLISKSFLTDDIPYQELGSNYHREFLGVSFDEEKDPMIQKLISKIKKETEIH